MTIIVEFESIDEIKHYLNKKMKNLRPLKDTRSINKIYEADKATGISNRPLIIKELSKDQMIFDITLNKTIQREFYFLRLLSNTGLAPKPFKYIDGPKKSYLVMEKLCGEWIMLLNLADTNISEVQLKIIIKNVIEKLMQMGKKFVLYTDIKMENIMVNRKTQDVKFIDFEDSIHVRQSQDYFTNKVVGTIGYAAPEVFSRQLYDVVQTQVFGIGCLVYSCLEKKVPFVTVEQTYQVNYEPPKLASKHATNFINACFMKDPNCRPVLPDLIKMEWMKNSFTDKLKLYFS